VRINVYSQELTSEVKVRSKTGARTVVTGVPCHPNGTPTEHPWQCLSDAHRKWWNLSGCPHDLLGMAEPFREEMAKAFEQIAEIFRSAPEE
jgi:hypothetical protein